MPGALGAVFLLVQGGLHVLGHAHLFRDAVKPGCSDRIVSDALVRQTFLP
jgi:hypothetical protein